jgi:FixJ family two-component response regulator
MSLQHGFNNGQRPPTDEGAASESAVYVLDDDASVARAIERLLRAAGVPVKTFTDPHALLQCAEQHQPRVVVTDIWMPVMDGLEVQQRLRRLAPQTRVIVLTSNDDPAVRAKAMAAGAARFFLKPADDDEFLGGLQAELEACLTNRS